MEFNRPALGVLVMTVAAGAFAPSTQAESCLDYATFPAIAATSDLGHVHRVAAFEGRVLAADIDPSGIHVYDATEPANPQEFGVLPGCGLDIDVLGNTAYVTCGSVRIYDVTTPMPALLGTIAHSFHTAAVSGTTLYAIQNSSPNNSPLYVYDIANPAAPVQVGFLNLGTPQAQADIRQLAVEGNRLYGASHGGSGIWVIDVTDPATPVVVTRIGSPGVNYNDVVSSAGRLYSASNVGLEVFDLSGANPQALGVVTTPAPGLGVAVSGGYAFVACGAAGLVVVDVEQMQIVTTLDTPGSAQGVSVDLTTGVVVIADDLDGLHFVDPASVAPPTLGTLDTPGWATAVAVRNGIACLATIGAGFRIADVTDLHAPVEIAALDTYANAAGVDLEEARAYLADGSAGIAVVDLTSPSTPVELSRFDTPGEARAIDAVGSMAYVADQSGGLRILDVANPTSPVELGSFDTPGSARDVLVEGTYAYVADSGSGLTVVNATNPAHPVLVTNVPMPGTAFALAREAGFTYVAAGTGGVVVVRPAPHAIVRTLAIPEFVYDVAIEGKRLYVANGYGGVRIYNITANASPILVAIANQPFQANGLGLADGSIFVADAERGLRIIPQQCQNIAVDAPPLGDFAGVLSVTNPARGTAQVRLRLSETNRIELQLFDVAGRQLRTLITTSLTPGDHRFEWNGRDDRGSRVANGVYLARMVTDHGTTQTRFVYLR